LTLIRQLLPELLDFLVGGGRLASSQQGETQSHGKDSAPFSSHVFLLALTKIAPGATGEMSKERASHYSLREIKAYCSVMKPFSRLQHHKRSREYASAAIAPEPTLPFKRHAVVFCAQLLCRQRRFGFSHFSSDLGSARTFPLGNWTPKAKQRS
jgi:hypothetical protein